LTNSVVAGFDRELRPVLQILWTCESSERREFEQASGPVQWRA
jgi:hypothetical protein